MRTTTIADDGSVVLGADAAERGYRPGAPVKVLVLSSGSVLIWHDDTIAHDAAYRPLAGGAAQLALKAKRRKRDGR